MSTVREVLIRAAVNSELGTLEVARALDISPPNVSLLKRKMREGRPVRWDGRRIDAGTTKNRCEFCDQPIATSRTSKRCRPCRTRVEQAQSAVLAGERARILHRLAGELGRVPTVTEASAYLWLSRSRAGEVVVYAFGPDNRDGVARHAPRVVEVVK